jgi:hypothetical protein
VFLALDVKGKRGGQMMAMAPGRLVVTHATDFLSTDVWYAPETLLGFHCLF